MSSCMRTSATHTPVMRGANFRLLRYRAIHRGEKSAAGAVLGGRAVDMVALSRLGSYIEDEGQVRNFLSTQ